METNKAYKKDGMFAGAHPLVFARAEELRKSMTHAEELLWFHLKQKPGGVKFRRQHAYGPYIFDFYCHKAKLVIEIDGSIHDLEEVKKNDTIRQKTIEDGGLRMIRFKNEEVIRDAENVVSIILSKVKSNEL